mgnify:CR=1 FL=1|jgi:uncharacterized protein (TIGR00297 family)
MIGRVLAGFALATLISLIARRTRSLTSSGAIAATLVGTLAVAAGWSWGVLLVVYFASSTALSHIGKESKEHRTAAIVAKGGARDATQVLANGAMFGAAALVATMRPDVRWIALGAGSLAASAADTWATEIGTLYGGAPRSILTWRAVAVGTSGGVSAIGTLAAIAGALFVALVVATLGWTWIVARNVMIGGVVGALADSLFGATIQSRRWCDTCERETERIVHDCGTATRNVRGFQWIDNDMVNFLSSAAGGLIAAILSR